MSDFFDRGLHTENAPSSDVLQQGLQGNGASAKVLAIIDAVGLPDAQSCEKVTINLGLKDVALHNFVAREDELHAIGGGALTPNGKTLGATFLDALSKGLDVNLVRSRSLDETNGSLDLGGAQFSDGQVVHRVAIRGIPCTDLV